MYIELTKQYLKGESLRTLSKQVNRSRQAIHIRIRTTLREACKFTGIGIQDIETKGYEKVLPKVHNMPTYRAFHAKPYLELIEEYERIVK